jgi:hypothetical protein
MSNHILRAASLDTSQSNLSPTSPKSDLNSLAAPEEDIPIAGPSVSQEPSHLNEATTSTQAHTNTSETTVNPLAVVQEGPTTAIQAGPSVERPLAVSLSARQLLNQRLQKYKLPAMFRADPVGPADNQRWKGTFWIKDTLIGASKLERSKALAKESAALSAIKWLNTNHYY